MGKLLPDQLKALWHAVYDQKLSVEACTNEQERLLGTYRQTWEQALRLEPYPTLTESLLAELGSYMHCPDIDEIRRRCSNALGALKDEWHAQVDPSDHHSVERFYDASEAAIYELMWWHTLAEDPSPLAYVTALHFARQHGCQSHLDFGSGVGSGAILFAHHGLETTLADISSTLLSFSRWRVERRRLPATYIDLKTSALPHHGFDFITAMDVFEHLVQPVETVERLCAALKPGGFLYARVHAEEDEERPQHIVQDFAPTLQRMRELGLLQVWQDDWLWGHQVFQKT